MISYQWGCQKTAFEIGRRLVNAGFKIWLDNKNQYTGKYMYYIVVCYFQEVLNCKC